VNAVNLGGSSSTALKNGTYLAAAPERPWSRSEKPLILLVGGAGFEPATPGL
jgi:hypothetical protein